MSLPPAHESGSTEPILDPSHELPAPHGRTATVTDPAHLLPAETAEAAPKGSWIRKLIVLLIILGIAAFIFWRVRESKAADAETANRAAAAAGRPTPVLVTPVQLKTVPVYLTALGTITAYNTVTLHSRVDGQLLKVNFAEGQNVREGQLLLQIDPRPYQAALAQAQGQLAKDEANQKNAQAEAQRYTALYQAGVVSKESQQTQLSNEGQAAGSIAADLAAIQAAKVNLSYTSIYSPINGVVGLRGVDPGNIVHASDSTGLVVITQVHPISVIFTLPEDQLPQVQQAMRGGHKLGVDAYDRNDAHLIASGNLLTIDNQIDTTTGTAKLKAVFDNADNNLFPNQFVNVRLVIQQRENSLVVPTAAVQSGTQGTFVFVVRDGAGTAGARGGRRGAGGAGAGGAGAGGAGAGGAGAGGAGAAGAGAAGGSGAAAGAGGGGRGNGAAQQGPPKHVVAVNVHVDFAQGANSIVSGGLKGGDLVVVDGQEKLTDGSNVIPQMGPQGGNGAGGKGTIGASGANNSGTTGASGSGSGTMGGSPGGNQGTAPGTPGVQGTTPEPLPRGGTPASRPGNRSKETGGNRP